MPEKAFSNICGSFTGLESGSRGVPLPLSHVQERIWSLEQLSPGCVLHHLPVALHLRGVLDEKALERAVDEVVGRHEALRLTLSVAEGEVVQESRFPERIPIHRIDLSHLSSDKREPRARCLIEEEATRPFDLLAAPLFRITLFLLGPTHHILLLNLHQIIADSGSMDVVVRELAHYYSSFVTDGVAAPLAASPLQYPTYSRWQRSRIEGGELAPQLSYWMEQLERAGHVELPAIHSRPATPTYRRGRYPLALEPLLVDHVNRLSQQEGTPLFVTILTALVILLHRYSGQQDIVVGSRATLDHDGGGGPFSNLLALRTRPSGKMSGRALLAQLHQVVRQAHANGEFPFEELLSLLPPERRGGEAPLFNVMCTLDRANAAPSFAGLELHMERIETGTPWVDLAITLHESEQGVAGWIEYNCDLFDEPFIGRMAGHLGVLLESLCTTPQRPIGELSLLTDAEREQLLSGWNRTHTTYPQEQCIQQLFEAQVARRPDAIALVSSGEQLSYEALNLRANQLAHYLRAQGVGPDTLVGLCLPRSVELIVTLLAILKAGGAYMPLDPSYPEERLRFMFEDSRLPLLLTTRSLRDSLPPHPHTLCLDEIQARIDGMSEENPSCTTTPDHLAYINYTSGSTGRPKGVAVRHRGVLRLLFGVDYARFDPSDTFLHLSPASFDASTFEIWGALLHGARCVLFEDRVPSPERLGEVIAEHGVTTLWLTASLFNLVIDEQPQALAGVRQLLTGGEALSVAHVRRALEQLPSTQLINGYGPTESTTFTCCYPIPRPLPAELQSIPIGRPIGNTTVYLLDANLQPVPIGVPGELYIGGDGLARAYLNRPALTAERFLPDPFGREPGGRLYRTGDLARYLPDGRIDFLGRTDHQVKIRGFRIELGEIEAVLGTHPAVREVVVLAREIEGTGAGKQLVAYIVPQAGTSLTAGELREYMQGRMPAYMIPPFFLLIDAIPLSPNGKVDRKALPTPQEGRIAPAAGYVPPRDPTEEMLATVWSTLLNLVQVGVQDNFFELGGHSLLATRVLTRVRELFHVEVPLPTFFDEPTIEGLAREINRVRQGGALERAAPLVPRPRGELLPLSYAQQRLWFLYQLSPESSAYNIVDAVRLRGKLDVGALERSLQQLVARHESLRTTFTEREGRAVQVIDQPLPVHLPLVDLSTLPPLVREEEMWRRIEEEADRPFDLARGPLFRVLLLRLDREDHTLVFNTHHVISDGWSVGIFRRELAALYRGHVSGSPVTLPPLPIQYADFTLWQREWVQGKVLEEQLAYWCRQLADPPPVLALPTDRPRPAVPSYRGGRYIFRLPPSLVDGLKELGRRQQATLFMTLLAGFQCLLYRYSGQEDIAVGSPIANRTQAELEGLIGFFVNTLVMRTDLSGDPTFVELLGRVRQVALGAYAHQDLPFEKLVEVLNPDRDLSHTPLFQVLFVLQNTPPGDLDLPGLTVEWLPADHNGAQFDLLLSMQEDDRGLEGTFFFNSDLFDEQTIIRLVRHLQTLLEAAIAAPELAISRLPLLASEERTRLQQWSAGEAAPLTEQCVHEIFKLQAQQRPAAIALEGQGERLNYSQLERRANQLARYLRRRGVGPDVPVAICLERSVDAVVAVLAILKAGGAYVPLDPTYPPERLAAILADSRAPLLLTHHSLAGTLPVSDAARLYLDSEWPTILQEEETACSTEVTPDHLAYVIFTSGSTGRPKGVGMSHRALVNLLHWQQRCAEEQGRLRTLQFAPLGFDVSFQETFATLSSGGTLVLIPEESRRDPERLLHLLEKERIERLFLPFVALQQLADVARLHDRAPVTLREIITAGEQLQVTPAVEALFSRLPHCTLHNQYGPTESHVVTAYTLEGTPSDWPALPPIGRPIANARLHILDAHFQPVPVGVPGELFIGGITQARGYLNRPALTAERFVPDPFSRLPGARLYRSGDLARWLPDGNIEFLGRADLQVKIRGFRVELGEIEATLLQHPAVREAVVVAREGQSGHKALVAYLVGEGEQPSLRQLRAFLESRLPDYMVPAAFVWLDHLPLSPNGKVNRRALPAPDPTRLEGAELSLPPRNPVEEAVALIWSEVLGRTPIGVEDDFFDLGGHSLLATQTVSRVYDYFQIRLPLRVLFERRTVAGMAEALVEHEPSSGYVEAAAQLILQIETLSAEEMEFLLQS